MLFRSEQMTFIGYDMGAKAYRFMRKDNSMVIAIKCLFDKDTFPRAKSKKGTSTQNKQKISPPGINDEDQEEICIPPNPNTKDIDHNHEDPHDKGTSDDTRSVTTRGLNVMHSGHVGPPGIIFFTYLSFHSTLTPVLLVRYISIPSSTYPMPTPFAQILYTRYPSPYATRI